MDQVYTLISICRAQVTNPLLCVHTARESNIPVDVDRFEATNIFDKTDHDGTFATNSYALYADTA